MEARGDRVTSFRAISTLQRFIKRCWFSGLNKGTLIDQRSDSPEITNVGISYKVHKG